MSKKYCIVQNSLRTTLIFRRTLLDKLVNNGHEVTVVAPMDCIESRRQLLELDIDLIALEKDLSLKNLVRNNMTLYKVMKKSDDIICFFIATFVMHLPSLFLFRKNSTVSIEGLGTIFSRSVFLRELLKAFLSLFKSRVFCNLDEKNALGNKSDYVTGGIGVDIDAYKVRLPLVSSKNRILYVGRLIKDKGIFDVLSTFKKIKNTIPDATLTIVGEIYESNPTSLKQDDIDAAKKEFGSDIEFAGFQHNLNRFYNEASVLLLPSIREGFPTVVMEASCCGLPSVCWQVPGCLDAIEQGVNGYCVEFNDYSKLAETTINAMLTSSKKSNIEACVSYAHANFDRNKKVLEFIENY